jgi:Transcription elongation factor, GreA/GreB, C-term
VTDRADADRTTSVVEVGATVHARDVDSGKRYDWTIVSTSSEPTAGKISAETKVAKALLGHRVGEVVPIASGTVRRYEIEGIDAAPVQLTPAASTALATPPAAQSTDEIAVFGAGQEIEYEEWVRRNSGGYVLKQRDRFADGHMLHLAECSHLWLTPGTFTMRTGNLRRCSRSRKALVQWCREETGSEPVRCQTCFS